MAASAACGMLWPRCGVRGAALVIALASLFVPAAVRAQVVELAVGNLAGGLSCPQQQAVAPARPRASTESTLVPPDTRELAGLPLPREAHPQQVDLGERGQVDASRPFSIGLWGDSHAASNYFSEALIRALGLTPEQVQPTFIPPTMARGGVRLPLHKYCQGGSWTFDYAYTASAPNGDFAKGLVNLRSSERNSYLWLDFRRGEQAPDLRALDLLYAPQPQGDTTLLGISADDGAERFVELKAGGDGVLHLHMARRAAVIKLRLIVGTLVLQGLAPQYADRPALYLDTLGIPGATVRGWKGLNTEYFRKHAGNSSYDLVILEYGTNEGNDQNLELDKYAADLRASLRNLRQLYPESMCVLIGPTDRGVLVPRAARPAAFQAQPGQRGLLDFARIHQRIGAVQASVGKEYGCAFWSWQDAMGGPGAAYYWLRQSPPLMAHDLTHLTTSGYQLSAKRFVSDTGLAGYVHAH